MTTQALIEITFFSTAKKLTSLKKNATSTLFGFLRVLMLSCISISAFTTFISNSHADANINTQNLIYSVSYGSRNVGEIHVAIVRDDDGYVLTSTTKPRRLVSLFLKEHTSDSRFIWMNGELAPLSVEEKLKGDTISITKK